METDALDMIVTDIRWGIDTFNWALDIFVPIICAIFLIRTLIRYTSGRIKIDGHGKGIYLGVLALFEMLVLVGIIHYLPQIIANFIGDSQYTYTIRWIVIYSIVIPAWYFFTRNHSGARGAITVFVILVTLTTGWFYDRWVGIVFVSTPLLLIYYHVTSKVAQVIYPASEPENTQEIMLRVRSFLVYLLGIQYPVWVAKSKAARDFDKRIDGDTARDIGKPGIVWMHSHQVAGTSKGIEFNKVDGPGIVFTEQFETPVALVDLRTQLRTCVVNTVTKDGMDVPAVVFVAFAIDKEKWPKTEWTRDSFLKLKFRLGKDYEINHPEGSHPYSSGRVRAALSTFGVNAPDPHKNMRADLVYWDEWALAQVEHATRQVISKRSLDELWRPRDNKLGASALNEMAEELKALLLFQLEEVGVQIFTARIVNYTLESKKQEGEATEVEDNPIVEQNIRTWGSHWEQRITEARSEVEFIYREEIAKAHAYSKSVLLSAIADSISKAREIREDLPRHLIAQYFVHALDEYIKRLPGGDLKDAKARIDKIKEIMNYSVQKEDE